MRKSLNYISAEIVLNVHEFGLQFYEFYNFMLHQVLRKVNSVCEKLLFIREVL